MKALNSGAREAGLYGIVSDILTLLKNLSLFASCGFHEKEILWLTVWLKLL